MMQIVTFTLRFVASASAAATSVLMACRLSHLRVGSSTALAIIRKQISESVTLIMLPILALILLAALPARSAPDPRIPREILHAHNEIRDALGLPPLRWSDKLAGVAKDWATTMVVRSQFQHSHRGYGENLYEIRGGRATPRDVVDAWASESADYDYRTNRCKGPKCGHYTQIVWRDTNTVGCAMSFSSFREVWVCEYSPPGNWVGQRPY